LKLGLLQQEVSRNVTHKSVLVSKWVEIWCYGYLCSCDIRYCCRYYGHL